MIAPLLLLLAAAPSTDTFEQAKQAFREGVVALDAGRASDAVSSFRLSLSLRESPAAWFNLGMSCRQIKDHVCVVTSLEKYLTYEDAESGPQLKDALHQSRQEVARISVAVDGPFEAILVDGKEHCTKMPCRAVVSGGSHTLVVQRAAPMQAISKSIVVAAGEQKEIALLQPASPPPPPAVTSAPPPAPPPIVVQPKNDDEGGGPPWWVWAGAGAVVAGAIVAGVVASRPGVDGGSLDTVLVLERMQ